MRSRKFQKGETLPVLKTTTHTSFSKEKASSFHNSPSKTHSLADVVYDNEKLFQSTVLTKDNPYFLAYPSMQQRTQSLANSQLDLKKSLTWTNTDLSIQNTQLSYIKKEENKKKVEMWEKLGKLKAALSKYQDPNEEIPVPTRADLKKILHCLETLNDSNSGLAELMAIVVRVLRTALFVNPGALEPYEEALSRECSEDVNNVVQLCKKEGVPYYFLCMSIIKDISNDAQRNQKLEQYYLEIQRLQELAEDNQRIVKDLKRQLEERISPEEHQELLAELQSYKEALEESSSDNQRLKKALNETMEENNLLKRQLDDEVNEGEKQIAQIQVLEKAKENIILETEGSRNQVAVMKQKIKGFKDTLDKIILKLGDVKHQVLDLRRENEELRYKNDQMNTRATFGFDALTPRPDYRRLQEEKKFDLDIYDESGRRQMVPTIKIVEEILNRLHPGEMVKEGSFKRKDKLVVPKINASTGQKGNPTGGKGTIAPAAPKSKRNSILEVTAPNGQKTYFGKETPFSRNNSQRNATTILKTSTEGLNKDDRGSSRINITNEDSIEEDKKTNELQEIVQNAKSTQDLGKGTLSKSFGKFETQNAFGEETIKEANNLIDYVVEAKKEIDKFE